MNFSQLPFFKYLHWFATESFRNFRNPTPVSQFWEWIGVIFYAKPVPLSCSLFCFQLAPVLLSEVAQSPLHPFVHEACSVTQFFTTFRSIFFFENKYFLVILYVKCFLDCSLVYFVTLSLKGAIRFSIRPEQDKSIRTDTCPGLEPLPS